MEHTDRRSKVRMTVPECVVFGPSGSTGRLLDVSSEGVRVEIDSRCLFARGEQHRLVLSNVLEFVEVEGLVRWTQSRWKDADEAAASEYRQRAGFTLSGLLTPDPGGIWSSLLAGVPFVAKPLPRVDARTAAALPPLESLAEAEDLEGATIEVPIEAASEPVAPATASTSKPQRPIRQLEILDPPPQARLTRKSVDLVCRILDPGAVSSVAINRVEATIVEDTATATIQLDRGLNPVKAVVRRSDGSYSTYLLGKIERLT